MVTPEIYMDANAPTAAEGALKLLFWHGTPWETTVERSIVHAVQCGTPREEYRARIMQYLWPALESPEGLTALLRHNMWHSPGPQNVNAYLSPDWETNLTPAQILAVIRRNM